MADNRAGLKAGLGAEHFSDGGLWCVSTEQISLSNYMRSIDAAASGGEATAGEHSPVPASSPVRGGFGSAVGTSGGGNETRVRQELAAAKIQDMARQRTSSQANIRRYDDDGGATPGLGLGEHDAKGGHDLTDLHGADKLGPVVGSGQRVKKRRVEAASLGRRCAEEEGCLVDCD